MRALLLVLGLSSIVLGSCRATQNSDLSFAIAPDTRDRIAHYSLLSEIQSSQGHLNIEVAFKNFDAPPSDGAKQMVYDSLREGLRTWVAALPDDFQWRDLDINIREGDLADCRKVEPFWTCDFGSDLAVIVDHRLTRSYSNMYSRMIVFAGDRLQETNPGDRTVVKTFLHEMGHLFGLGDAYSEAGYQLPQGQPEGIMNILYDVDTLTADDKAGITAIWDYISKGKEVCTASNYVKGSADVNTFNNVFCIPKNRGYASTEGLSRHSFALSTQWQGERLPLSNNGHSVSLAEIRDTKSHLWHPTPMEGGYHRIESDVDGRCLDVNPGNRQITLTPCASINSQLWKSSPYDGTYSIFRSKETGEDLCLDIISDGQNRSLHMSQCGNYSGQHWKHKPEEITPNPVPTSTPPPTTGTVCDTDPRVNRDVPYRYDESCKTAGGAGCIADLPCRYN